MADHSVYQIFNEADELIYVGCTLELGQRISNHRETQPWAAEIVRVESDLYATREIALAYERALIKRYAPKYNLVHAALQAPMSSSGPLEDRLRQIGRQRELAQRVLAETSAEMPTLVRALYEERRLTKKAIARLAGISRPTLDAMLKDR